MFDTKQIDYNVMHSPFGRDVVKELAERVPESRGCRFGVYYSVCDWRHPDFPHGSPDGKTRKPHPNLDRYEHYLCRQVAELLCNYGPLLTDVVRLSARSFDARRAAAGSSDWSGRYSPTS